MFRQLYLGLSVPLTLIRHLSILCQGGQEKLQLLSRDRSVKHIRNQMRSGIRYEEMHTHTPEEAVCSFY